MGDHSAIDYAYDALGRLTGLSQGEHQVTLAYDAAGRRTRLTLPNGIEQLYRFDAADQLLGIDYRRAGQSLGELTYRYDEAGLRIAMGGSFAASQLPEPLAQAQHNAHNQLTLADAQRFTYDENGNLSEDGRSTYVWNARNQLVAITGARNARFAYDAFGRRIEKRIDGVSTTFQYDGLNFVRETRAGQNTQVLTGLNLDEVLTRTEGETQHSILSDALGNTLALANQEGQLLTRAIYGPYGTRIQIGADNANSQWYTGREEDGTGLMYYRARYYHPELGRFISEDPIGLAGGVNGYAYVEGNPISYVDPLGLAKSGQNKKAPGTNYTVRVDNPHVPGQQKHAHVYDKKGKEIVAVSKDGSGSHGHDPGNLPKNKSLRDYLRKRGFLVGLFGDLMFFKDLVDNVCSVVDPGNPFCDPSPPPDCIYF